MKRSHFLLAVSLILYVGGVKSQTVDVTSTYIRNASFEDCEVVSSNDKGAVDVHTDYATALGADYSAQGWQLVEQAKSANGGAVAYAADLSIQYSKWNVIGDAGPSAGPAGTTGNKGLCFSGNASVVYRQTEPVTLPAGSYTLTIHVWARNGETSHENPTQQVVNIKTGFLPEGGNLDSDLVPAIRKSKSFASNQWDTEVLEFELLEATKGRIYLSYGSSYFVVIDDLKLEHNGGVVTTTLLNALVKAKALNLALDNSDLAAAIAAAEAFAAQPTTQDEVPVQVETLFAAMSTALAASDGVVDITAAYVENPSFETGMIAPWEWTMNSGSVDDPVNDASRAFIDGSKIAQFSTTGSNNIIQTVSHLPAGNYIVEARLNNGRAKIAFGSSSTEYVGGADALFLRVASPATAFAGGETTIGVKGTTAYRVDDFHLYYSQDAAALGELVLQHAKADAQRLLDDPALDMITGSERTELIQAVATGEAVVTKTNAFYKAQTDYAGFERAKQAAEAYTAEAYPYAKEELLQLVATLSATVATSATHASVLAGQLSETCFNLYVSNAYCEGVERTDYTEVIIGANASETPAGWAAQNMTVRTDKKGWTDPKSGATDAVVYGVTSDYYRASKDVASILKQTFRGLPAGKYVLSMTAMGTNNLDVFVFFNAEWIGTMTMNGTSGGGKYGAGWNEYVLEFVKATDADMPLQLQCKPEANYQEWYIDNFRLYKLSEQPVGITSVEASSHAAALCYDLAGRRVLKPSKGLYIVGGKKVLCQ